MIRTLSIILSEIRYEVEYRAQSFHMYANAGLYPNRVTYGDHASVTMLGDI